MVDEVWRPLGVESEEHIARYDALAEGLPPWIEDRFWGWVRDAFVVKVYGLCGEVLAAPDPVLAENICQRLRIKLPNIRIGADPDFYDVQQAWDILMNALMSLMDPIRVADSILAFANDAQPSILDELLARGGSAWTVGERGCFPGLVRRVSEGVQLAADSVMKEKGRPGVRLAQAWEFLYGVTPNASRAYAEAIKAVEAASIPIVCPSDSDATLGKVIGVVRTQGWKVPMQKEHDHASANTVLVGMLRLLWCGQHDRHDNGRQGALGAVSIEEAAVAVGLAVTLVHWFTVGLVVKGGGTDML